MSQYKQIDGERFEKDLLKYAEESTTLNKTHVTVLFNLALDGHRITATEKKSLLYICDNYRITDDAKALMMRLINAADKK